MSELRALTDFISSHTTAGRGLALATVVDCEGSVYRRPGARMVIAADGAVHGGVSGGCLESDLLLRAPTVIQSGSSEVIVYRGSHSDSDAPWGLALGCNGMVTVLLERVDSDQIRVLEFIRHEHARRNAVALGVGFDTQRRSDRGPSWAALSAGGSTCESWAERGGQARFEPELRAALERESTAACRSMASSPSNALFEFLPPPERLVIIGAGHDAIPIVRGAVAIGWETIVTDHRPGYLREENFVGAALRPGSAGEMFTGFAGDARTAALVMTHHLERDRAALQAMQNVTLSYLGILGPRDRTRRLLKDLEDVGCRPWALRHDKLYAPVGLAIHAETAEEIAVAVLAELIAVSRGGHAKSLRELDGSIHPAPLAFHGTSSRGRPQARRAG